MGFEIYYFTGTGNSLAVAKDIAKKTDGKLIAIKDVVVKKNLFLRKNRRLVLRISNPQHHLLSA